MAQTKSFFTGAYPLDPPDEVNSGQKGAECNDDDNCMCHPLKLYTMKVSQRWIDFEEEDPCTKDFPGIIHNRKLREEPTFTIAKEALKHLKTELDPHWKTRSGHINPKFNIFFQCKVQGMISILNYFTLPHSSTYKKWGASTLHSATSTGQGGYCTQTLAALMHQSINNHTFLPISPYGY